MIIYLIIKLLLTRWYRAFIFLKNNFLMLLTDLLFFWCLNATALCLDWPFLVVRFRTLMFFLNFLLYDNLINLNWVLFYFNLDFFSLHFLWCNCWGYFLIIALRPFFCIYLFSILLFLRNVLFIILRIKGWLPLWWQILG